MNLPVLSDLASRRRFSDLRIGLNDSKMPEASGNFVGVALTSVLHHYEFSIICYNCNINWLFSPTAAMDRSTIFI